MKTKQMQSIQNRNHSQTLSQIDKLLIKCSAMLGNVSSLSLKHHQKIVRSYKQKLSECYANHCVVYGFECNWESVCSCGNAYQRSDGRSTISAICQMNSVCSQIISNKVRLALIAQFRLYSRIIVEATSQ